MSISKKKTLGILSAALVAAVAAGAVWHSKSGDSAAFRQVPVQRGDIEVKVLATGIVQPENRLEIKPPIPGRVETVLIEEGKVVRKGQILAWMSSTERAALVDAARARGSDELKRWEELYRPTPIIAPIDGTIILRKVEPGQTFTSADAVLVMSNRLSIKAQVDETDIAQIQLKQPADIVLDAYSTDQIPGTVNQIAFEAKTVNNVTAYIVDVVPVKAPPTMRSGMTANVKFSVASKKGVLLVPNEAVHTRDGVFVVSKLGPGGKPEEAEIELGITDGKNTEVLSGLDEKDAILLSGVKGDKDGKRKSKPASSPFGVQRHR